MRDRGGRRLPHKDLPLLAWIRGSTSLQLRCILQNLLSLLEALGVAQRRYRQRQVCAPWHWRVPVPQGFEFVFGRLVVHMVQSHRCTVQSASFRAFLMATLGWSLRRCYGEAQRFQKSLWLQRT